MVGRNALLLGFLHVILVIIQYAESSYPYPDGTGNRDLSIKASHFLRSNGVPPINALRQQAALTGRRSRIHHVTDYGADPTGRSDSTDALEQAIVDAFTSPVDGHLNEGVPNLGGSEVHLDGGTYMISQLRSSSSSPLYEYITLKELMLDSNFRGGGIAIINSIRTTVDNCYISHFTTTGISIQDGHETYIRNSFIGQHINIGGDDREKDFSGIGINITGNDNAVTDVVIFSASIGVMVQGQANMLTGIHCYNKATALGGTGIYIRAPGLTQTRVVNCYLDFTGIVAEDPVQLHVTGSFFLGNAFILLKSVKGVASGVNIVDNMFAGDYTGVPIVKLDQSNAPFKTVDQVVIERNNVRGMVLKSTVARGSLWKNGTTWTLDFSKVLLFPNLIPHVHYALHAGSASSFPRHILRSVSRNRVTVQTDVVVSATVHVSVDQTTVGGHI
ncbi:hypothetical protein CUMW_185000 [Citrus unshiu]|uniref:Pectate lyase superfamily protein domain-containing protein n=1 Tax=Citrus unshiu TaxID=55188 RepID=A0A2H5Q0J6_CITUN|nr:hypothetical protein CUMW_185000 [Citrus unshiu]